MDTQPSILILDEAHSRYRREHKKKGNTILLSSLTEQGVSNIVISSELEEVNGFIASRPWYERLDKCMGRTNR